MLRENLRRLKAAGIRVGTGTDAGIGGVYHGSSALREIRLLTQHGFTPAEALVAATSVSAGILRQEERRGRIAPGMRADLILVAGRPDLRIEDIYALRRAFVGGRELPLEPLRRLVDADGPSPLPVHAMAGPVDTGARADGRTDLDTLPFAVNEAGIDHSRLHFTREPAPPRRLLLAARLGAAPQPFAGLVVPLTRGGVHVADARAFSGIAFEARGTGRYAVMIESYGLDQRDVFRAPFAAAETRREIRIPFAAMRSEGAAALDLARLRTLVFRLEGEPGGQAALELANIRFYR
jgi:hypothetical protein